MPAKHLLIKNMVCPRCISSVQQTLHKLNIPYQSVRLGEVLLKDPLTKEQLSELQKNIVQQGFDLVETRVGAVVEKVKNRILEYLDTPNERKKKLSAFITEKIPYEYSYLSDLFSSIEGITIEKHFINQRIEKVKESLVYRQQSLSEIAFQLGYSSSQHLSAQFKKITGLSPSHFKDIGEQRQKGR